MNKITWKLEEETKYDGTKTGEMVMQAYINRRKHPCATVWRNGTWHTWDRNGYGGENSHERYEIKWEQINPDPNHRWHGQIVDSGGDVFAAMKKAEESIRYQKFDI
jgi:hypothetical protein